MSWASASGESAPTQSGHLDSRVILTRAGGLRPLFVQLDEIGAPTARLLVSAGLPAELPDEPDVMVPIQRVHRFIEKAALSQGIDDLGARLARRTSAFDTEFLGPALRQAVTVYDYFQTGIRLIGQVTKNERFWLTIEKDQVRLHHESPGQPCLGRVHEDAFCMVMTVRMLREFLGPEWNPTQVDLLSIEERTLGDLGIFGDALLRFGQPHSSFSMPSWVLQQRIPQRFDVARPPGLRSMPIKPTMPVTFIESIETLVDSLLLAGALRMDTVAESASMSTRTLQRRLSDCGCSYSEVVHRSRIRLASDWLTNTTLPVGEISAALGYTDPSNFTRSFRRTTGISPTGFRGVN